MAYRVIIGAALFAAGLGGCSSERTASYTQEAVINLSPSETFAVTDALLRKERGAKGDREQLQVSKPDGTRAIAVNYVREDGSAYEIVFHIDPGPTQGQTKFSIVVAPAADASAETRAHFPQERDRLKRDFERLATMLNHLPKPILMSDPAHLTSGTDYAERDMTLFYDGPQGAHGDPTAVLGAPPPQNPSPSADASAPTMSAQPGLDPTVH